MLHHVVCLRVHPVAPGELHLRPVRAVQTVHAERASLPRALAPHLPGGRTRQYVVYAVLEAMIDSAFDALDELEAELDALAMMSSDLRGGRVRMAEG